MIKKLKQVKPIEIKKNRKVKSFLEDFSDLSFQARTLGNSVNIYKKMIQNDAVIFLSVAGALVPAGLRKVISFLIENKMVDVIVCTGATIFHDFYEAMGYKHYKNYPCYNDKLLLKNKLNRIYDTFIPQEGYEKIDKIIQKASKNIKWPISSAEYINYLGYYLDKHGKSKESILFSAYRHNVPVFSPLIVDSAIGISLYFLKEKNPNVLIDNIKDIKQISNIVENSKKTAEIVLGGGYPKHFVHLAHWIQREKYKKPKGYEYAIQFTTDNPQYGGLSGCTFEESKSWGKCSVDAQYEMVFVDATIGFPLLVQATYDQVKDLLKGKNYKKLFKQHSDYPLPLSTSQTAKPEK